MFHSVWAFPLPLSSAGHCCTSVCEGSCVLSQCPNWCNFPWTAAPRTAALSAPALLGKGKSRGCPAGGTSVGNFPCVCSPPLVPHAWDDLSPHVPHQVTFTSWGFCNSGCSCPLERSCGFLWNPLWNNSTHPIHIAAHVSSMPQPLISPAAVVGELWGAVRGVLASGGNQSQPLLVLPAGVQHREQIPFHSPVLGAAPPAQVQGNRREVSNVSAPSALGSAPQALVQGQVVVVHTQLRPTNLPSWSFSKIAPYLLYLLLQDGAQTNIQALLCSLKVWHTH